MTLKRIWVFQMRFLRNGVRMSKALLEIVACQLAQKNLCKRLMHDGAETQKSWKPLLNTIFVLRGLAEWFVQWSAHEFFCAS